MNSQPKSAVSTYSWQKYYWFSPKCKIIFDTHENYQFSNIAKALLDFSLLLLVKFSLILYFFWYQLSLISLLQVISLPTIAICFAIAFKSAKEQQILLLKQRRLRAMTLQGQ